MYVRWMPKKYRRSIGVIQRKFQVLRNDVEVFYLTTMNDIVFTAIILHNMMVRHRFEQGETKSEDVYVFGDEEDNINREENDIIKEMVERQDAEVRMLLIM